MSITNRLPFLLAAGIGGMVAGAVPALAQSDEMNASAVPSCSATMMDHCINRGHMAADHKMMHHHMMRHDASATNDGTDRSTAGSDTGAGTSGPATNGPMHSGRMTRGTSSNGSMGEGTMPNGAMNNGTDPVQGNHDNGMAGTAPPGK